MKTTIALLSLLLSFGFNSWAQQVEKKDSTSTLKTVAQPMQMKKSDPVEKVILPDQPIEVSKNQEMEKKNESESKNALPAEINADKKAIKLNERKKE
jgi:hypothetical protein